MSVRTRKAETHERVRLPHSTDLPAPIQTCAGQCRGCFADTRYTGRGEQVEILGGAHGQALQSECCAAGQQEAPGCIECEEDAGDLQLKLSQRRVGRRALVGPAHDAARGCTSPESGSSAPPRAASITGRQAARIGRGKTRSGQASTSSAPST